MLEVGASHTVLLTRKWTMEFLYEKAGRTYDPPELDSRFEDRVGEILLDVFPGMEIVHDKEMPAMRGFKKGKQRVDFYIEELNLIVEADGKQHIHGRDNPDKLDEIRANDRLKDEYAATNGITLIRIPETIDCRKIKAQLLRGIRRDRPRFRPLNPSNALNTTGPARRGITRSRTRHLASSKSDPKDAPLEDVYCRGCHSRPSYKNISTYLCESCWDRWNQVRRSSEVFQKSDVDTFKKELIAFIKERGRYVWSTEAYLYLRPVSQADLKKHGIKVATLCRDLGFFAPADDRITRKTAQRVKDFVRSYMASHNNETPNVPEALKGSGVDHTAFWSCMDFKAYIAGLGGKIDTRVRHRFRNKGGFLEAAVQVVKEAGRWLPMTSIVKGVGISYPTYLLHFKSVRSKEIHEKAGVNRSYEGVEKSLEVAARATLNPSNALNTAAIKRRMNKRGVIRDRPYPR